MRNAANEIARLIEQTVGKLRISATQIIDQIGGSQIAPATGSSSGAVSLSDDPPADIGTADSGADSAVSRSDHVHALPASGVAPGTYGDATNIPQITVDAEGRITVATDVPAAGGGFPNQNANEVFAGPASGPDAPPAFRALVAADIPNLDAAKITTGVLPSTLGGTGVDNAGRTLTLSAGNLDFAAHGGDRAILFPADGYAVIQQTPAAIQANEIAFGDANNSLNTVPGFEFVSNQLRIPDTLRLPEQGGTPGTPASGFGVFYVTSNGVPAAKDDGGVVREMVRHVENTAFTPSIVGAGTAGTFTYAAQRGHYTRINNLCFFRIYLEISAVSVAATGDVSITNLPFTSATGANGGLAACAVGYINNINLSANCIQLTAYVEANSTIIRLMEVFDAGVTTRLQGGTISTSGIILEGFYQIQ